MSAGSERGPSALRTRRKTGTYAVGRERRARIVDAASHLFAGHGHQQISLSRVASEAGLTVGGLMHHFPSKRDLLVAVAERRLENTAQSWANRRAAMGSDPVLIMRNMIQSTRQMISEPGLIELFVLVSSEATDTESPAHALLAAWNRRAVAEIAELVRNAVARGYFRADVDPDELAREIIAVSIGLQFQWVLGAGELDFVETIRAYAQRLAASVLTPTHANAVATLRTA